MTTFEVAHQIGLIPFLSMLGVGRKLPAPFWWVALALAVSWFADSASFYMDGTWAIDYFWLPLQFWMVACAFTAGLHRALWGLGLIVTAALSWDLSGPGPDFLITLVGSVSVLYLARGALALPIFLYFGLGTLAYFVMAFTPGPDATTAWYFYQGCRLVAFLAFIGIIAPQVIRNRGPANVGVLD